ncbi:Uncharacterised protein [Mycobacteroides abscessus subsp. abscessus]|nr:Uncharacterised protein [Mycobacteroides abscessus subsp. abscessus]
MPRPHSAAASGSWWESSILLAASSSGLSTRRSICTIASSIAVMPTRASTTRITTSAWATASSAWAATCALMPLASDSHPPVSTRVKALSFHSAW